MAQEFTTGRFKSWLDSATPNAGGRLYTYASGTTTFKAAYTDATLATPCTYTSDGVGGQYIALNSRGEAQVWLGAGVYTMVDQTPTGVVLDTTDGIQRADGFDPAVSYPSGTLGGVLTGQGYATNFRSTLLLSGNGPWANPAVGDAQHLFEVVNDNTSYQCMALNSYGATTNGNNLHWNRYRGTLASPTAIKNGDYFMSFGMRGWDGSGVLSQSMAAFQYQATEDWTPTAHGGRIKIEITKTGSSTRLPCWKLYAGAADGAIMELGDETSLASRILNASTTGFLQLHGSQDQTGAQAIFYGSAHATLPNQAWVRADVVSFQDRSGNETLNINPLTQQLLIKGIGGFGYTAGAGNTQAQSTTKGDAITSNTPSVKITMSSAALAANTAVSFTWNSTKIGADDHVHVQIRGGVGGGAYNAWCDQISAGSARIVLKNITAGSLSDAVVLQVSVIKGASS